MSKIKVAMLVAIGVPVAPASWQLSGHPGCPLAS